MSSIHRPGPKVVNVYILHPTYAPHVTRQDFVALGSANERYLTSEGQILLHFQIDYPRMRAWLGVVENLAADLLLRQLFINRYVQSTFLADPTLVPWYNCFDEIILSSGKADHTVTFADHKYATPPAEKSGLYVEAAEQRKLRTCSHTPVLVTRTCSFHLIIGQNTLRASLASSQVAVEIIKVAQNQLFYVLLMNVSK